MAIRSRLSRREMLALVGLPVAGACAWGVRQFVERQSAAAVNDPASNAPARPLPQTPEIERLQRYARAIEPLYIRMPPPEPGDWLAEHTEFGQTFAQYLFGTAGKLCEQYQRIGLVPLGTLTDTQRQLLADTADFLPRYFGFPVEILEPVPLDDLPEEARRVRESGARQVLAGHLLNKILPPRRTDDMAALVGFTASDLWDGAFSFLFGSASPGQRVCVGSVARFGDMAAGTVDYSTLLRRTLGVIVHETGHTFGLMHCIEYLCRMTGSNHLAESDRRPLDFCPECLPKIWWTSGVDPAERFQSLREFAVEHRLTNDGKLWQAAAGKLIMIE